ncbi:hypothetical protein [Streptomyces sp. NPDC003635]
MTPETASSALGVAVVCALLGARTAVRETRHRGSARKEWAFLVDRRAMSTFLVVAVVLGALCWGAVGLAQVPWAVLVALLVARVSHKD